MYSHKDTITQLHINSNTGSLHKAMNDLPTVYYLKKTTQIKTFWYGDL